MPTKARSKTSTAAKSVSRTEKMEKLYKNKVTLQSLAKYKILVLENINSNGATFKEEKEMKIQPFI
jgi:hypothetical protein